MRQIARVDANHGEIVSALRYAGAKVRSTAQLGSGFPDLLVGWKGELMLFEIKDGSKPPSQRKLTGDEQRFFDEWSGFPVYVVQSPIQALSLLKGCLVDV